MSTKSRKDVSPERRAVGRRLQEALDLKGMTHRELAAIVGRSTRTVEAYVAGEFAPKEVLFEIEQALDISAEYLLLGRGAPSGPSGNGESGYITYGEFRTWRAEVDARLAELRGQVADLKKQVERLKKKNRPTPSPPQA